MLAAPSIGMLWAPSMALLSDGAEALGIAQGFAFALSNLGWSIGQTAGAAGSARLADATQDAVPYLLLCAICVATLLVLLRARRATATSLRMSAVADAAPRRTGSTARSARAAPAAGRRREADLVVVGGGLTGLWTALRRPRRASASCCSRGSGSRSARPGRNGGFCAASLTTGIGNGLARWPERAGRARAHGPREPRRDRARRRAPRDRLRLGGHRRDRRRDAPHQVAWLAEEARALRRHGWHGRAAGRGGGARAGRLADLPRRACGRATACALVDPARLCWGLARAAEAAGAERLRGHAGDGAGGRRRRRARRDAPGGRVLARRRAAGDERVPAARARDPPLRRAGLRLRARHRAAVGRRSATRSAGAARPGALRHRQPVPLLPPDRRPPDPVGRLRRGLRLRRPRRARARPAARRRSPRWPSTSSRRSRSSRGCASRTAGAARSTRAAASRRCGAARSAGARSTSSASPGWAWGPAASARASGSTCSTGSTRSARGWRWCGGGRCRSRRSRRAGRASR